jgi:hypothetical protein
MYRLNTLYWLMMLPCLIGDEPKFALVHGRDLIENWVRHDGGFLLRVHTVLGANESSDDD